MSNMNVDDRGYMCWEFLDPLTLVSSGGTLDNKHVFTKSALTFSAPPSRTAIWLSVPNRFQMFSLDNHTVHLTSCSPRGSENKGLANAVMVNGVDLI